MSLTANLIGVKILIRSYDKPKLAWLASKWLQADVRNRQLASVVSNLLLADFITHVASYKRFY